MFDIIGDEHQRRGKKLEIGITERRALLPKVSRCPGNEISMRESPNSPFLQLMSGQEKKKMREISEQEEDFLACIMKGKGRVEFLKCVYGSKDHFALYLMVLELGEGKNKGNYVILLFKITILSVFETSTVDWLAFGVQTPQGLDQPVDWLDQPIE